MAAAAEAESNPPKVDFLKDNKREMNPNLLSSGLFLGSLLC